MKQIHPHRLTVTFTRAATKQNCDIYKPRDKEKISSETKTQHMVIEGAEGSLLSTEVFSTLRYFHFSKSTDSKREGVVFMPLNVSLNMSPYGQHSHNLQYTATHRV